MKVPISWLKEYVEISLPIEELAFKLTLAGLEVEEIRYVGLPMPEGKEQETKITGISWGPEEIVVGEVSEVLPHPDADRLVLCQLDDGKQQHTVLTGAPNLFPYKGKGPLDPPLKVVYAREGATIIDAYNETDPTATTTLKRKKIRGVESYSMACSEKELGISDEHEGIILLDQDAPTGMSLVEYMGDAVLDIAITPNIARAASILGVAREVAAITGAKLKYPEINPVMEGEPIKGRVSIDIKNPEDNPRFVLGLIENVEIKPSPYWAQLRLKLAGVRPIDALVDATNYTMLEIGEPLHAFDYDVLVDRAKGKPPVIITRRAKQGESLTTLDDVERKVDDFTVLVTDQAGPLSLAGVMGGAESEVQGKTKNVLLEGASWNYVNVRRTVSAQVLPSEAAYRFERGVHPEIAPIGVKRCLEWMRKWTGGTVAKGLVDEYPLPQVDTRVALTPADVERWLGISLSAKEIAELLTKLEFSVSIKDDQLDVTTPPHRLDIGEGMIGKADLMEEIARVYGYDKIPETNLADGLPLQVGNRDLELEEMVRDQLAGLGLQEIVTYRITSPEADRKALPPGAEEGREYLELANPISADKTVMRQELLASMLEVVEKNFRSKERIALFEIGPVFLPEDAELNISELPKLALCLYGSRSHPSWQGGEKRVMDYYDLKGIIESLLAGLHIEGVKYLPEAAPYFHPGKSARIDVGGNLLGYMGEVHPQVKGNYKLPDQPLPAAILDINALLERVDDLYDVEPVPDQPPVLEDLALVVDDDVPAQDVQALIQQTGGKTLRDVRLFDVYRGEQLGEGKKSLAYSLVYQHPEKTLTDKEVLAIRNKIVKRLEKEIGAKLRSW
ncbi:MAG: phenylalanine--tRNA ligase subunit beta [Anaerolineales bacterium]|nr:phenylalanine--tRNA ligase subunit beta [Anaerolineales bacterium]